MITVRSAVDAATTTVIMATCAALLWASWKAPRREPPPSPSVPSAPVSFRGAALKGNPEATVVVVEFSDYQCPYCGKFQRDTMPLLDAAYVQPGKILWAFRHHPVEQLHPRSKAAAQTAVCAEKQGKFWELHSALFAHSKALEEPQVLEYADGVGLNLPTLKNCMLSAPAAAEVQRDIDQAIALGLHGTPAFLIGARQGDSVVALSVLPGAAPFEKFKIDIERALAGGLQSQSATYMFLGAIVSLISLSAFLVCRRLLRRAGGASSPALENAVDSGGRP